MTSGGFSIPMHLLVSQLHDIYHTVHPSLVLLRNEFDQTVQNVLMRIARLIVSNR
jgi:hypothetical protein